MPECIPDEIKRLPTALLPTAQAVMCQVLFALNLLVCSLFTINAGQW